MATVGNNFPRGLGPREVKIFNAECKTIWHQERSLLNNPLADFRSYEFVAQPGYMPIQMQRNLLEEFLSVPCSVPNLDSEIIVNSGGLVMPTDRFLSAYDVNPNILSVVEWPSGSGNLFTIRTKEYNAASGRCEMLIRQNNHLKGVIYRRVTGQTFGGSNWKVSEAYEDIVITANRNELSYDEQLIFAGVAATGDLVFWALKSAFILVSDGSAFVPSVQDVLLDQNDQGVQEVYRIVGTQYDEGEAFYKLLTRRFEEA